ncbi:MAG: MYXO-CTERM sorting domain-containing protein, partial [Myxococcota bacterium]|nr:MYXO-CTERM sorting domain-containing protein [Myxococcota bacterium]
DTGCSYLPVTGVPECEEPGPDAGPSGSDAGPSGSDAGPSGSDAGPSGSDAGPSGSDAGTELDVPTPRGSVGANAVGPSETPSGGCMGCSGGPSDGGGGALIGLMTLVLLFQRRRAGLSPS